MKDNHRKYINQNKRSIMCLAKRDLSKRICFSPLALGTLEFQAISMNQIFASSSSGPTKAAHSTVHCCRWSGRLELLRRRSTSSAAAPGNADSGVGIIGNRKSASIHCGSSIRTGGAATTSPQQRRRRDIGSGSRASYSGYTGAGDYREQPRGCQCCRWSFSAAAAAASAASS